jgi:4'-phosphopantetheinyl transferase
VRSEKLGEAAGGVRRGAHDRPGAGDGLGGPDHLRRRPARFPTSSTRSSAASPEAFLRGIPAEVALSISHGDGLAFCATAAAGARLGCDIERAEARSEQFVADYFTPREAARVHAEPAEGRPLLAALIWSAKESTLKALREGLRMDTRSVEVTLGRATDERQWAPVSTHCAGDSFSGWWTFTGDRVLTVICSP